MPYQEPHRSVERITSSFSSFFVSIRGGKTIRMTSILEHPLLYELALGRSETEISQDCIVLQRIWESYAGKHVRQILEIGCGTAPHSLYLAGCGYQVAAIDLSKQMLEEAKRRARKSKVPVRFYLRDARRFSIPETRCDAAIFMYQTFPLLLTNNAIYSHFHSVANHLRDRGLYIIDLDREIGGFRMDGPELGTLMSTLKIFGELDI
jgi:SAM-dependent methyltransferase